MKLGDLKMMAILKSEKSYQKLFLAGIVNGIGSRFSQVALLSLILKMTGSSLSVGITLALSLIPFLLFGPFSSRLAKKVTRKKLLIGTDILRAIIAISFLFIDSSADLWIAYVGSFLLACGEAFYSPTRKASIPAIVQAANLKEVNSWEQVSVGFVLIIGAMSGGIVSFIFGAHAAFGVNILSFIAAGLILSKIPSLEKENPVEVIGLAEKKDSSFLGLVSTSPLLMMLFAFEFAIPLVNGIENVLLSVYAVETFKAGDLGVGILYSVLGVGFIVSPFITKYIKGRYLPFAFICLVMEGVILAGISQTGSFAIVVCLFGMLTIFGGVGSTLLDTVAMETIPAKWHGSYFGMITTLGNTCLGLSMFITGMLLEVFTPREMGLTGGILYIVLGVLFFCFSFGLNLAREKEKFLGKTVA
jgi:MFS family permease